MHESPLAALPDLLRALPRGGDDVATGKSPLILPHLDIEGVGVVSFPVLAAQAAAIAARCEEAPYGRGDKTLVDPEVRRVWQLSPDRLVLRDPFWPGQLAAIVAAAAHGLGVEPPVQAQLYKLLLYEAGSFFVSHRDTEKADGMFATHVVVLPSAWEGGELIVRHAGRESRPTLSAEHVSWLHWAAFYADCEHEVRPVTAGWRVCLVYNLLLAPGVPRPATPDPRGSVQAAAELLHARGDDDEAATRFVYPLEHRYTPASLSWSALKGRDAGAASVLAAAGRAADRSVYLAMLTVTESGSAEEVYQGYRHRRSGPAEYEIVEVLDRTLTLTQLSPAHPDDPPLPTLACNQDEEILPAGGLDELPPDTESFEEATGSEGGSFERSYRAAALVVWPRRYAADVEATAGWGPTMARLAPLVAVAGRSDLDRAAALHLARAMMRVCPGLDPSLPPLGRLLDHLSRWPVDEALLPAVLATRDEPRITRRPSFQLLLTLCVGQADARLASPPVAPADWRREAKLGCSCHLCAPVSRFLASRTEGSVAIREAQAGRSHIEGTLRAARADVDARTVKSGSPHLLVLTKTPASYQREVEQHKVDLATVALLAEE